MSSRRSRLSLSLVRRSESPMSPIGDRTRSSISEVDVTLSSGCSTPLNTRKRGNSIKTDSPVLNDNEHSPIIMSQDASNVVTGVSWAWNSPKRAITADHKSRSKPLTNRNIISNKDPDFSRSYRMKTTRKLTGFHRFQNELKLLQERDEPNNDMEKTSSCSSMKVVPPTSPPPSPDKESGFVMYQRKVTKTDTPSTSKTKASPFFKPNPTSVASDSFNDSELDNLLLQASQAIEITSSESVGPPKDKILEKQPEKRRSFFKSKTTDNFDGNSDDSLADTDLDLLLAQMIPPPGVSVEAAADNSKSSPKPCNSKTKGLLTRHKSMPESPSRKITESTTHSSRSSNMKYAKDNAPQSPVTVSSASSGSIIFVPTKAEVVSVPSSSCSSKSSSSSSTGLPPVQVCSKEEIEQKRQEALKRQAHRLKRIMQGNHSQGDAKFFKSRKE